jgi:hypothetical protein
MLAHFVEPEVLLPSRQTDPFKKTRYCEAF